MSREISVHEASEAIRELDELSDGLVLAVLAGPPARADGLLADTARWRGDRTALRHDLPGDGTDLRPTIARAGSRGIVLLVGLERLDPADRLLALRAINLGRDRLLESTVRLVWWVAPDDLLLVREACPDLWAWVDLTARVGRYWSRPQPEIGRETMIDRLLASLKAPWAFQGPPTPSGDRLTAALLTGRDRVVAACPVGVDDAAVLFQAHRNGLEGALHSTDLRRGDVDLAVFLDTWRPVRGGAPSVLFVVPALAFPERPHSWTSSSHRSTWWTRPDAPTPTSSPACASSPAPRVAGTSS